MAVSGKEAGDNTLKLGSHSGFCSLGHLGLILLGKKFLVARSCLIIVASNPALERPNLWRRVDLGLIDCHLLANLRLLSLPLVNFLVELVNL